MIDLRQYMSASQIGLGQMAGIELGRFLGIDKLMTPAMEGNELYMNGPEHFFDWSKKEGWSALEYLETWALGELFREGVKVVKPSLSLCQTLQHIDLNIAFSDYAQPYTSMGVVIPGAIAGQPRDLFALIGWKKDTVALIRTNFPSGSLKVYKRADRTIEDMLVNSKFEVGLQEQEDVIIRVSRICFNLGLFATSKQYGFRIRHHDREYFKSRSKLAKHNPGVAR